VYLVDTNVLAELRRPERTHRGVAAWADSVAADDLFVSAASILEIEIGILRLARRDAVQAAMLRAWMERQVLSAFGSRILPINVEVALRCARLHVPDQRSERDAMIGATALVHHLTVVTRNVADFQPMGVVLLNPWAEG
jgi:toxin FitB